VAPRIFINTHFAKDGDIDKSVHLRGKEYKGKQYDEVNIHHPQSGMQRYSVWLFKDDLVRLLHDVGYDNVRVVRDWSLEFPKEQPTITIFAEKDGA